MLNDTNNSYQLYWSDETKSADDAGYWNNTTNTGNGGIIEIVNGTELTTPDAEAGKKVYFDGCTSSQRGGALYVHEGGKITLENADFTNCISKAMGGAIAIGSGSDTSSKAEVTLKNVTITGNSASSYGGAIYIQDANTLTVSDSTISGNKSGNYGGAVCSYYTMDGKIATLNFTNVTFENNESTGGSQSAGAIKIVTGILTLEDCTFTNNKYTGGSWCAVSGGQNCIYLYSAGHGECSLILRGQNTFDRASNQYIFNQNGKVYFDLTESTYEDSKKAILNDYSLLYAGYKGAEGPNSKSTYITVSATQALGSYIIAGGYVKGTGTGSAEKYSTNEIYLQVDGTSSKVLLTLNAKNSYSTETVIGNIKYTLKVDASNNLVLDVGDVIYVNSKWTTGQDVPEQQYHGIVTPAGTCDNTTYFNDYEAAVAAAKTSHKIVVGVEANDTTDPGTPTVRFEGVAADLTKGLYSKMVIGGLGNSTTGTDNGCNLVISGGTYSKNVIGGSYASGTGSAVETHTLNLTVNGGTFGNVVSGGMYCYGKSAAVSLQNGSADDINGVNLKITGGSFSKRVYGGNYAQAEGYDSDQSFIDGNITVTVDCTGNKIHFDDGITVGSRGNGEGMIDGNTSITFTGNGSNLVFGENAKVWGGCTGDTRKIKTTGEVIVSSGVVGTRTLVFDEFSGSFGANVGLFSDLQVVNGSSVNFAGARLGDVNNWVIEDNCSISGLGLNDFTGDTLDLYGKAGDTLISGTEETFNGFDSTTNTVKINGYACEYDSEHSCWHISDTSLYNLSASFAQVGETEVYALTLSAYANYVNSIA